MSKWFKRKNKHMEGYLPMGEVLNWDVAMVQAVTALDHAAALSIDQKSPAGMREVAIGWLAVASSLQQARDEEEMDLGDSSDNNEMYAIGFRGSKPAPVDIDEDEEDYDYDDKALNQQVGESPSKRSTSHRRGESGSTRSRPAGF